MKDLNLKKVGMSGFGLVIGTIAGIMLLQQPIMHAILYLKTGEPIQQGIPYLAAMIFGIVVAKSIELTEKTDYTFASIVVGISFGWVMYTLVETSWFNALFSMCLGVVSLAAMAGFLEADLPLGATKRVVN